jgi:hypothetical protein
MAKAQPGMPPIVAAPGTASIVFLRPSGLGGAVTFTIIDHGGRFVGVSTADAHFAVQLVPGDYYFIADGENIDMMRAVVAEWRIYYVEVVPKMGLLYARVGLDPLKAGDAEWTDLPKWLAETERFVPLFDGGQAMLNRDQAGIQQRIARARASWAEQSEQEQRAKTLEPGDGWYGGPVGPPAVPAVPVAR